MEKKCIGREEFKAALVKKSEPTRKPNGKDRKWEKPILEDVSGRVMAQPYIRFT